MLLKSLKNLSFQKGIGISSVRPKLLLQHKVLFWSVAMVVIPTFVCVLWLNSLARDAMAKMHCRNVSILAQSLAANLAAPGSVGTRMSKPVIASKLRLLNMDQRLAFVEVHDVGNRLLFRQAQDVKAWRDYQQWQEQAGRQAQVAIGEPIMLGTFQELVVHRVPIWDPPLLTSWNPQPMANNVQERRLLGHVTIALREHSLPQTLVQLRTAQFTGASVICLAILPLVLFMVRRTVRPLTLLCEASMALAEGRTPPSVEVKRSDEIGWLMHAFNYMKDKLLESRHLQKKINEELERQVAERTGALEALTRQLKQTANQFEVMAATDPLTGIANRRALSEALNRAFADADRGQADLACVMIDLDGFKKLNDTLGHQMGDQVLQVTARAMTQVSRAGDMPGRYGGDEFALILPRADEDAASAVAVRLQRTFGQDVANLLRNTAMADQVTMSIGLAVQTAANAINAEQLLSKADHALYRAKKMGKNRIVIYSATVPNGRQVEIMPVGSSVE